MHPLELTICIEYYHIGHTNGLSRTAAFQRPHHTFIFHDITLLLHDFRITFGVLVP